MNGYAFILADPDFARIAQAAGVAAAAIALGRPVALLLKLGGLRALGDPAFSESLLELMSEPGISVAACQTDMDALEMSVATLPPGVEPLGLVAFLADHGGKQLVVV